MFRNLGIVREAISDTELKVYNSVEKKEVIVKASKDYVSSIKVELNDEDGETMIVEYDLKTKVVNENIE
ncbi:MAG: Bacillus phage SPbeta YonK domain-containing protein [uncultured Clostridium sp.]